MSREDHNNDFIVLWPEVRLKSITKIPSLKWRQYSGTICHTPPLKSSRQNVCKQRHDNRVPGGWRTSASTVKAKQSNHNKRTMCQHIVRFAAVDKEEKTRKTPQPPCFFTTTRRFSSWTTRPTVLTWLPRIIACFDFQDISSFECNVLLMKSSRKLWRPCLKVTQNICSFSNGLKSLQKNLLMCKGLPRESGLHWNKTTRLQNRFFSEVDKPFNAQRMSSQMTWVSSLFQNFSSLNRKVFLPLIHCLRY